MPQTIETRVFTNTLRDDGIAVVEPNGEEIKVEDIKEQFRIFSEWMKGEKVLMLYKTALGGNSGTEVRKYASGPEGDKCIKAEAIVVKNLATRLLANAYLKLKGTSRPAHIFTAEKDALKWLLKQKDN